MTDSPDPTQLHASTLQRGQKWLQTVLKLMAVPATVHIVNDCLEVEDQSLSPENKQILLSAVPITVHAGDSDGDPPGVMLDSLQYLANTLLNLHQPEDQQRAYTLDLGGYRQQRWAQLQEMTLAAVDHVRTTQSEYEFGALSAAERRQVHLYLQSGDYNDLESFSRGKEPDRRLVVRPQPSDPTPGKGSPTDRADTPPD